MIAEIPPLLIDAGTLAGILVALLAAVAAFSKTRPVRFLWRALVSEPIGRWQTAQITAVVEPINKKLDGTADALIRHMDDEYDLRLADQQDRQLRQTEMDDWRQEVRGDISDLRGDIRTVHKRFDRTLEAMAVANPKLAAQIAYDHPEEDETDGGTLQH